VIEDPIINATATTTKATNNTFTVNITNKGAGYIVAPHVTVSGTCTIYPNAVASLENGHIKDITLEGGKECSTITLTIDPPNHIKTETKTSEKWTLIAPPIVIQPLVSLGTNLILTNNTISNPSLTLSGAQTIGSLSGSLNLSNSTLLNNSLSLSPITDPYCNGTRPWNSQVLEPGSSAKTGVSWTYRAKNFVGPLASYPSCVFTCNNSYDPSTQKCI
jgi:hypothetical protein